MTILHLPLIAQFENRTSSVDKDAKMVNSYIEVDQPEKSFAVKRPGHDAGTLYEAGVAQGVASYLGVARVVVNNKFFKSAISGASLGTTGEPVDFA